MRLRNTENDPLVLYRVTLTPTAPWQPRPEQPELASQHPSGQRDPDMTPETSFQMMRGLARELRNRALEPVGRVTAENSLI
jgi:hypothetical protein